MTNENIQTALYVSTLSLGLIGHSIEVKRLKSEIKDLKKNVAHYKEGATFWGKKHDQLQNKIVLGATGGGFGTTFGRAYLDKTQLMTERVNDHMASGAFGETEVIPAPDETGVRYVKMHPPTTSILSFPCPHCEHQFGSKKALDAHVSQKHDPFGFTCVCGRFFSSKQGLGRHLLACKGTGTCTLSK